MIKPFQKAFSLLSAAEKRKFIVIVAIGVLSAMLEVVGVASIMPFMAVVSDPQVIQTNRYLRWGYETFDFSSTNHYLFVLGVGSFVTLVFCNAFKAITTWISLRFSHMQNHFISRKLLHQYLSEPYAFFLSRNSSELAKNIVGESSLVVNSFFVPALKAFDCLITTILIVLFLLVVDPVITILASGVLGVVYGFIYKLFKIKIAKRGQECVAANQQRFKALSEAFGGIKDIKLMHKESVYLQQYDKPSKRFASTQAHNAVISEIPSILLETVAYGGVLFWLLYLLYTDKDLSTVVPLLALYAMAARRLLPSLKEIFRSLAKMRFCLSSLDLLSKELRGSIDCPVTSARDKRQTPLVLKRDLCMDKVSFRYAGAENPVFSELSLKIAGKTAAAFVGPTGCGKTTAVDIILGLLRPQSGRLLVDGVPITEDNIQSWQLSLGYVPQHIYLADDTIASNIAFGVPAKSIDMQAVRQAASLANLAQFVETELPEGYNTITGERGIRLSGGQRQRIGIARALYHNPAVLVLDEATSALDTVTERTVMDAIDNIAGQKTIIMIAHRLTTVQKCDMIFFMKNGMIQAAGSYDSLLSQNSDFCRMANGQ